MKKNISALIVLLSIGVTNAQDTKYGAKMGLNIANRPAEISSKALLGINIGGFAEFLVSDVFSIEPELLYSMQGNKIYSSSNSGSSTYSSTGKVSLSYLVLPVMVKYYIADKISLEAGPQIGYLVAASYDRTIENSIGGITTSTSTSSTDKSGLRSVDLGINLGAGYKVSDNIYAGFRSYLGAVDTYDPSGPLAVKNTVFSFNLGYSF
jgi:Outer membrane protein beta-barrel domain